MRQENNVLLKTENILLFTIFFIFELIYYKYAGICVLALCIVLALAILRRRRVKIDLSFLFLLQGTLFIAVRDYYAYRLDIVKSVAILLLLYLIGNIIERAEIAIAVLSVGMAISGILSYYETNKVGIYGSGFYITPMSNIFIESEAHYYMYLPIIALILGFAFYKIKLNKWISFILAIACSIGLFSKNILDGRLTTIIEAAILLLRQPWGGYVVSTSDINSGKCMWLDYGRDYGLIVTVMLVISMAVVFVYCIKIVNDKENAYIDYVLIVAFCLFNVHFAFSPTGFNNHNIYAIGLLYCGMIRKRKEYICLRSCI